MIKEAIFVVVFSLYGAMVDPGEMEDYYGSIRIETVVPSMAICKKMKANYFITKNNAMEDDDVVKNSEVYLFCNLK